MEPYSSFDNTEDRDDEPYYRTVMCNPDDIVCPGSDEEETAEETRRKRLRYEAQARRYIRGHRPVLLTASLRGPFSKESGWVNPWARPSRSKQNQIRPQLDSEVVASTRSKIAEKTSSTHGLGYVNPEAVLAWQAKVGALESSIDEEGHTHREEEPIISTSWDENLKVSGAAGSELRSDDSMRNHYTKTPHIVNDEDFTGKGTKKRAADSQWLKGSYVSKRARWGGPALSSPTPGPDSFGLRGRERRHASARLAEHGNMNVDHPKSATHILGSSVERPRETPIVGNALPDTTLFSAQIRSHRNVYPATRGTLFLSSMQIASLPHQVEDEEIDELQGNSQESRTSSQKSSGKKSRRSLNKSLDPSSSDLEQDDLVVITPHSNPHSTPAVNSSNSHLKVGSLSLPKPPRPSAYIASDFTKDSSEVAPSSRNLEKFHFKKRKRRTKSAQHEELGGGQGEALGSAKEEENPPIEDDGLPSIASMPTQTTPIEAPEIIPEIEVADEDAHLPSAESVLAHLRSSPPDKHSDVEDASDDMGIQFTNALESLLKHQNSTTLPSEPQRLCIGDGGPSLDNGEADTSFDIGEMSFLRAVLRAGNSGSNTPFNEPDLTPKSTGVPIPFFSKEENIQHSDFLSKSVSNVSQQYAPSSLHQNIPRVSLSSQRAISSQGSDEEDGQQLGHVSTSKNGISQQHSSSSSSQRLILPSQRTIVHQNRQEENRQPPEYHSKSSKSRSQHRASSSPRPRLSQRLIPSQGSKISLDPNNISTQSYNTTPVKSQRSARRSQSTSVVKSPRVEEAESSLAHDEPITEAEQDEMDRIQLELSQVCPSSTPGSAARSDDHGDDLDHICQPNINLRDIHSSTNARHKDPCSSLVRRAEHYSRSASSQHEEESVFPGVEESVVETESGEAKHEQKKEISPDLVSEDSVVEVDAHVEADGTIEKINEPDKGASEASWEGREPQSPWAIEHIAPIPLHAPRDADLARPFGPLDPDEEPISVEDDDAPEEVPDHDASSAWQRIERPQTPENSGITPFRDLITSTDSPERTRVSEALTSTQLLIQAATSNPWGSGLKKPSSIKIKKQTGKRVSFDGLSSQHSEDEPPLPVKFGPVSPLPPTMIEEEGMFNNGTTSGTKFESHFKRHFTRLLPEDVASPMNSSPALGAQAEAFIAADRETSIDQDPTTTTTLQTPTRHLKPRSEPNSDLVWRHQDEPDILGSKESPPVRTSLAGFDMQDALGEMGDFLEDWSVDTELKQARQARASSPEKREESNGYRRRKLFGIV
ncbi:uncharacterized protein PAC_01809 [Phialocephala subalpina]|uniref:Protamine P1 n=1 Tax=Phialocephala subalpina TaxID=576137 RepID=A0A1L7WGN3_9HELO|nr:uncharacterized protein PAC_01809 [Phialocephala subalpina]